jgi:hypothetical protein
MCEEQGKVELATDLHHSWKLRYARELQYDEQYIVPLCHAHHAELTAQGQ